jgi:hypothetical protein
VLVLGWGGEWWEFGENKVGKVWEWQRLVKKSILVEIKN